MLMAYILTCVLHIVTIMDVFRAGTLKVNRA